MLQQNMFAFRQDPSIKFLFKDFYRLSTPYLLSTPLYSPHPPTAAISFLSPFHSSSQPHFKVFLNHFNLNCEKKMEKLSLFQENIFRSTVEISKISLLSLHLFPSRNTKILPLPLTCYSKRMKSIQMCRQQKAYALTGKDFPDEWASVVLTHSLLERILCAVEQCRTPPKDVIRSFGNGF